MRILTFCLGLVLVTTQAYSASENLDEIFNRKERLKTATYSKSHLEDPTTLVWQPETLQYTDISTGGEVWRLTNTPELKNSLPDITWSQWSADGKRFGFGSNRDTSANTSSYETSTNPSYAGAVMLMRADGAYLRPANGGPFEVFVHARYLNWSPVEPDVYYGFGRNFAGEGLQSDELYKVTVSDESLSKQMVLDMNLSGIEVTTLKYSSSDGLTLLSSANSNFYPITLLPTPSLADADGWARSRALDSYWGQTPSGTSYSRHDTYVVGTGSNAKIYFIPEGYSSWWRMALSGSGADGGPEHTVDNAPPYNWGGEVEPVFTGFGTGLSGSCGTTKSPWNCDGDEATGPESYLSHPGFDRWGKYVAGINSQQYMGMGVWDLDTHAWHQQNIPAVQYGWHTDWDAWSDYFVSTPSGVVPETDDIYIFHYNGTDTRDIASVHTRESRTVDYNSLPRVTQSPDGTKAVFHSDFLHNAWTAKVQGYISGGTVLTVTGVTEGSLSVGDFIGSDSGGAVANQTIASFGTGTGGTGTYNLSISQSDLASAGSPVNIYNHRGGWELFYAVAYYPHPPEITQVANNSGTYTIRFDWRTDQTTSRGYTQRGWPNEATDDPPPPRETKLFRLWRSADGTTWSPIKTVNADIFGKYNFATGEWSGNKYWEITDSPGAGTFYYAVTAQEHSGLESHTLSNVFSTAGSQTAIYPSDPKSGIGVTGVYQASMIRHYNIYAEDGAAPVVDQTNRIASIPVSSGTSYVDWLGDTDGSTQYKVTAVDTQGNESAALSVTSSARATPGHYDVSWSGSGVQQGRRYRVRTVDPQ